MFDQRFHQMYCGEVYDVEFHFSRGQFKRMHQAIEEVVKNFGCHVLFPNKIQALPPQVDFLLENPILKYQVYPSQNKIRSNSHSKIGLLSSKTPSPRKKSVVENLFGNKLGQEPNNDEWMTPVLPLQMTSKKASDFNLKKKVNIPLQYEFKMADKSAIVKSFKIIIFSFQNFKIDF